MKRGVRWVKLSGNHEQRMLVAEGAIRDLLCR
jgi:hypothetical protein